MHGMNIVGYYVQSRTERKRFSKFEQASDFAKKTAGEAAITRAEASGTIDPQLEFEQLPDGAENYRIRARAVGNPRLMKGK